MDMTTYILCKSSAKKYTDQVTQSLENDISLKANTSDLNTATSNLQTQIDQIAQAAGTGSADTEVAQARVGADGTTYNTLKARLDANETDVQSVFENILEITHGKNLVDESTLTTLDVTGTGTLKKGYNLGVLEAGTYVISYESAVGTYYFTIIKNGVYTQKLLSNGTTLNLDESAELYIRSNDMTFNVVKLQFEKGSMPTSYEPYKKYGDSLRLDRCDNLEEATVNTNNRLGIKKESKNLVDESTLMTLDVTGTGTLRKGYNLGGLDAGTYVVSYESAVGTYYFTIIKNNVYTQKSLTNGKTLRLDEGDILYIRSNDMTFNIVKLQFEKGSVPTAYEPYNLAYGDSSRIIKIEGQITEIESTLSVPQNTYYVDVIPSDKSPYLYGDILFCNGTKYMFDGADFIPFSESNEPYDREEYYDVVIIGGGTGGVAAAYPFIGTNYRVAIVEKNGALGGVACLGYVSTWIEGYNTPMLENIFTSLKNEGKAFGDFEKSWLPTIFSVTTGSSLRFEPDAMSGKYENDLSGNNFNIFYDSIFVNYGEVVGNSIESVIVRSGDSTIKLHAKFFVDASTDASLVRSVSGIRNDDYYYGRDYQSRFNESLAITSGEFRYLNEPSYFFEIEDAFDDSALLNSIMTVYRDGDTVIAPSYIRTDGYPFVIGDRTFVNTMYGIGQQGMYKLLNNSNNYITGITKMTLEYWKYIKLNLQIEYEKGNSTFGGWSVAYRTYGFVKFADMISDRETYRINCDEMLTQSNLATLAVNSGDIIAVGSHNIDMHVTTGLNTSNIASFNNNNLKPYAITYRMIIPKKLDNTFVASKCFGASQIANASARIAKVVNQLGYVAGNAIKYSLNNGISDVRDVNISELKGTYYTDFNNRFTIFMSYYNGGEQP